MSLSSGTRLGPYEIVAPIGAGGMGEVYKANDTRLDRIVALKMLPASLTADPQFCERFTREAKSISALSHPNICPLFDVGSTPSTGSGRPGSAEGGGGPVVDYLVMEYLEGETLAARLERGALPLSEALKTATEIASALDKAHRLGIVHRDLKPGNIMLVKSGGARSEQTHAKLLDFGLAKIGLPGALSGAGPTGLVTSPRPAAQPLTAQGTILGTFQYMAPEQIEGEEADARTDIFAFGAVLFEMLTGRRAFAGKSQPSLIGAILKEAPPPVSQITAVASPALDHVVGVCLAKDPDARFQTAHDLLLQLKWIAEGGSAAGLTAPAVAGRKRRHLAVFAGAAIGFAALAAAGAWFLKPAPVVTNVVARFSYPLAEGVTFSRSGRHVVAISPDGTKIAFIANEQIYLHRMNELEAALPIRGTHLDPLDLTFSPDGQSIAFFVPVTTQGTLDGASLKKISLGGGKAVQVCPAGAPYGIRWQGGRIVFSLGTSIQVVNEEGGKPKTLVSVKPGSGELFAQPQFLNDGRALLYTVRRRGASFNEGQIVVQTMPDGDRGVLVSAGMDGRVLPSGHLIYTRDNTLFAQAFNPATLQVSGGEIPVVEDVRQAGGSGAGEFALSEAGTLVYVPGANSGMGELVWVDRQGHEKPTGAPPHNYLFPRLSPTDGTKIAVSAMDGDNDILVWDDVKKTPLSLTSGPDTDLAPVWALDGRSVIFRSNPGSQEGLFRRAADGTGRIERLTNSPDAEYPLGVLKDGRLLLRLRTRLSLLTLGGEAKLEPVLPTVKEGQTDGAVSPDGRWIAYQSREGSTREEIHVRPFPNTDAGHKIISSGGGSHPVWAPSGLELIYCARSPVRLVVVKVAPVPPGADFVSGTPETLLDGTKFFLPQYAPTFDISADGQRFLMAKPLNANERPSLTVVMNWFDELRAAMKGK